MKQIKKTEITKEQFDKANEKGAYTILNEHITLGYGVHAPKVYEDKGAYYLEYESKEGGEHEVFSFGSN